MATVRSNLRFCLLTAYAVLSSWSPAPADVSTILGDASREELLAPVPRHALFQPRSSELMRSTSGSTITPATIGEPLPHPELSEKTLRNIERLQRQWEGRPTPERSRERVRQALAIPEQPTPTGAGAAVVGWEQIGIGIHSPDGYHQAGRVTGSQYVYDDALGYTTVYVGTVGGGIWKLFAVGPFAAWLPVSDNLPGSPSVGAFLVDSTDSDRIWIGSGDKGRYTGDGLYHSVDAGESWTRAVLIESTDEIIPQVFYRIVQDYDVPAVVMAASDEGIWRSEDAGQTWTRVWIGDVTDLAIDPVFRNYWYAGVRGLGILESNDFGQSFHPIGGTGGTGIAGPVGRVGLTVSAAAPNYVYALVETNVDGGDGFLGGIYRSSNYGYDWTAIETEDNISFGQGWHAHAIAVDPTDPDLLFVGMVEMQWTANATAALPCWARSDTATGCSGFEVLPGHADQTAFTFVPDSISPGNTELLINNDGGIYVYDWNNNTLGSSLNLLGLNAMQIMQIGRTLSSAYTDPDLLLSGLQDNGIVRIDMSSNQKLTGVKGGDGGMVSFSSVDPNNVVASVGGGYTRYLSTQMGDYGSWQDIQCSLVDGFEILHDPTPLALQEIVTAAVEGPNQTYLYLKPFGTACDWAKINPNNPVPADVRLIDQANNLFEWIYYATEWWSQALWVFDSAVHGAPGNMGWSDRTPPLPSGSTNNEGGHAAADRSALQPRTVYYTTARSRPGRAWLSTNAGLSWQDVTGDLVSNLPDANYNQLVADPTDLNQLFLATDVGVFASTDRGAHWYRHSTNLPTVVNALSMDLNYDNASTPMLRIGTYGRGYWERPLHSGIGLWVGSGIDPDLWVTRVFLDTPGVVDLDDVLGEGLEGGADGPLIGFVFGAIGANDFTLTVGKDGDAISLHWN